MSAPDPYVPHRGSSAYRVLHYDLELDYRPSTNALSGTARLDVELLEHTDEIVLDLVGLGVQRVDVDGSRATRVRHAQGRLRVRLDVPGGPGERRAVVVRYAGTPRPQRGPWGEVGWEELTDGALVAGQPDGAPTWFPCNDLPGQKAPLRTTVRTDSAYTVVAPGRLVAEERGGSRTTWTYVQHAPTAPYLATVQVGRYVASHLPGDGVPQVVHHPARLARRVEADTRRQPEMVRLFSRLFGAYPFEGYTVVVTDDDLEIPLEAQSMAVFGANHVDGGRGSERLVAHELAHQWFGNSVGVGAWRDVWLNEGPACYAEWLWSEHSGGPSADELAARWHAALVRQPQDLVLSDPGPERMFDDRVYKRGALSLHALRRACGDEAFFALLEAWTRRHRHRTVTTDAWRRAVSDELGTGPATLLGAWLDEEPLPPLPR